MTDADRTLQGQYAGFVSRLVGFLIDSVVIGTATLVVTWATVSLLAEVGIEIQDCAALEPRSPVKAWLCHSLIVVGPVASTAFVVLYGLLFWATTGQTPGKAVMGVKIVRASGRPMDLITAVRRAFGYALSFASIGLGFLFILSDDRRQGWHDKLAGTVVIYAWEARQNERLLARVRGGFRRPSKHRPQ